MQENHILKGYICAVAATALWSGNFIIARGLSDSIPPVSLAFFRWLVAVIVFLPFALKPFIARRDIVRKNIVYLSVTAFLGVTLFNTLIYIAGHTTTAVNLSLISITFPVFIVVLSRIFFYELITLSRGTGIVLVVSGVVLLITHGDPSRLLSIRFAVGDIWMLGAALTFAVYSLLLKRKPEGLNIWAFQFSTFIIGLVFLLPFFVAEQLIMPAVEYDMTTVLSVLYVGIFASLTAFVLWNKAIVLAGPVKAGMIYYTLPLFSGFLAYLFLDEAITLVHLCCMVLIVTGIVTANYDFKKSNPGIITRA